MLEVIKEKIETQSLRAWTRAADSVLSPVDTWNWVLMVTTTHRHELAK